MVVGNVARTRILAKILTKPNALLSKKLLSHMKRRFPKEWKPALSHLFIQLANQQMSFEYLPSARDFSRH